MNILVAPDKFKGSLRASEVCDAIEQGLLDYNETLQVKKIPLADGGEGSLEVLEEYLSLQTVSLTVQDPLGRAISASYRIAQDKAFIEMSAASGLSLLKEAERNCMETTSFGTGQMIRDAYERGIHKIYLFVGGSATNDAGIGVLSALGIDVVNGNTTLEPVGRSLSDITGFDYKNWIPGELSITIICDVKNPLYGAQGAAEIYAPQKGASPQDVLELDRGLRNFAKVVNEKRGIRVDNFEGAGAAGGIAAGIKAFFPTTIQSGIEAMIDVSGLKKIMSSMDLVITGEGKLDHQTLDGKVVMGLQKLASQHGKKIAVICGVVDLDQQQKKQLNLWKIKPLVREGTSLEQAIEDAYQLVVQRANELIAEY